MAAHSPVCVGLSTHHSAAVLFSAVGHSSHNEQHEERHR